MKVLFVRSGNGGIDPISTRQGKSLVDAGLDIVFFDVVGKGVSGYLKNLSQLRNRIKHEKPDIIHSHYSLCGYLVTFTFSGRPVVVSLMGSDVLAANIRQLFVLRFFCRFLWAKTIVKSQEIYQRLNIPEAYIIPNGVDMTLFNERDKMEAIRHLNWSSSNINILFASGPERAEKNFKLAAQALEIVKTSRQNIAVHFLQGIQTDQLPYYYNATDALLLTSLHEGSPNVIKEAMACNCPMVATPVGDIKHVTGQIDGTIITGFDPVSVANALQQIITFGKRTNGRQKLKALELDACLVAEKIILIYKTI